MGLASALNTALTGLTAAETTIDVVGNNVANSNTVGFKSSNANFATQFLQTRSLGSGPTDARGGTNPRQIGLGVSVAEITADFSQGTIQISSNPSDLAIQGDGFFIVEGSQGERQFTRNGIFKTNAENQLVTMNGQRLLGHGIDDQFQIQATTLVPLEIPLGAAAVAKATENVFFEGNLTPTGDVADTAEIIQTGILGDNSYTAPATALTTSLAPLPDVLTAGTAGVGQAGAGGLTALGTYRYRFTFIDSTGRETLGSTSVGPITLGVGDNEIQLSNIPVDASANYVARKIYRTTDGGATYQLVNTIADNVTTSYTDGLADGGLGAALSSTTITGNYSYYVVFANAVGGPGFGLESRPSPIGGPINIVSGRVTLNNIPTDGSGQWTVRRIYRNLSTNSTEFHYVGEIPNNTAGEVFTDSVTDVTISANALIDLDGPKITSSTALVDILRRDGSVYNQVFQTGTLSFTGQKGGRTLTAKDLDITASTTALDLIGFYRDAMGIQEVPGADPVNPIPTDITGGFPGGLVTVDGRIQMIGNNGVDNSINIGLSSMQLDNGTTTDQITMPFGSIQEAKGQSVATDFVVYDSLGMPLSVRVTAVLQSRDSTATTYRWFADSGQNDPLTGVKIAVGTGLVKFDGEGNMTDVTNNVVDIDRRNVASISPLEFQMDFSQLSGLATDDATLSASRQDGSAPGTLASFIIGEDGRVRGVFSNGVTRDLGQVRMARFANAAGLVQKGENIYESGVNSGLPIEGNPNEQGIGSIVAGAVELSNTDIGKNLIDLILASSQYRGNTRVITATQQLLDELMNLRR